MADHPEIDALLISALYGELTPAEETRLAAHLESHPTDRTALADLTRARELVRESRVLQLQLEPSQAVSALILQEAARRAPKASMEEKEGWFARFVRSFAAHPAMAAAAMLVVVVGVATVVSRRGGDHFARSTAPTATAPATAPETATAPTGEAEDQGMSAPAAAEQYKVDLLTKNEKSNEAEGQVQREEIAAPAIEPPADKAPIAKATGTKGGVEVRSQASPQPKDLDEASSPKKKADYAFSDADSDKLRGNRDDSNVARQDLGVSEGAGPGAAPATPPPPPASTGSAIAARPRGGAGASSAPDATRAPDPALAWAREQHQSVIAQVRAGNCTTAANLAVTLSTRDPGYFTQHVASDRELKSCISYINNRVAQDTEQRARIKRGEASKRAVDQPAKPTTTKPAATESTK